jgi:hypothetical protein
MELIFNWLQDLVQVLHNAALDDQKYAEAGIQLCERVLAQFSDEDEYFNEHFRADLGEFYYMGGCAEDGERVLLELIRDRPHRSAGYVTLAQILERGARRGDDSIDPRRALRLLEEAESWPVSDGRDWDLAVRLKDLRDMVASR